jgi:hypothetical protein
VGPAARGPRARPRRGPAGGRARGGLHRLVRHQVLAGRRRAPARGSRSNTSWATCAAANTRGGESPACGSWASARRSTASGCGGGAPVRLRRALLHQAPAVLDHVQGAARGSAVHAASRSGPAGDAAAESDHNLIRLAPGATPDAAIRSPETRCWRRQATPERASTGGWRGTRGWTRRAGRTTSTSGRLVVSNAAQTGFAAVPRMLPCGRRRRGVGDEPAALSAQRAAVLAVRVLWELRLSGPATWSAGRGRGLRWAARGVGAAVP